MKNLRTFGDLVSTFVCSLFPFLESLAVCQQVQNALKAPFKGSILSAYPRKGFECEVVAYDVFDTQLHRFREVASFAASGESGQHILEFGATWSHSHDTSQIAYDSDRIMNEVNVIVCDCMWLYVIVQDEIFTYLHHSIPFSSLLNLREENPKIKDPEPAGILAALSWPEAQCHRHKKLQNQQTSNISNGLELFDSVWVLSAECYIVLLFLWEFPMVQRA